MDERTTTTISPTPGLDPVATGDALSGMAMLGKTAVSLLVVVAVILLFAWLVRRFNLHQGSAGQYLRVVGSVAVGQRERVVLVEVDRTWLVLGVGGGQVTRLHELPAQDSPDNDRPGTQNVAGGFAARLAQSLARRPGSSRDAREPSDGSGS